MHRPLSKFFVPFLFLHLVCINFIFGLTGTFNTRPLLTNDYAFHLYACLGPKHYLNSGHLWGYDPFFRAGYPVGLSLDNALFEIMTAFFPFTGQIVAMKIWVVLVLTLCPFLIYWTAKFFGLQQRNAIISMILYAIVSYTDPFFQSVVYYGMYNFASMSVLGPFLLSLYYHYLVNGDRRALLFLIVALPLASLIHTAFWIIFLIPFVTLLARQILSGRQVAIKGLIPIIVAALVSGVLILDPFMRHIKPYVMSTNTYFQVRSFKGMCELIFFEQGQLRLATLSILVLGIGGLCRWAWIRRSMFILFALTGLAFFGIGYLHGFAPSLVFLSHLQPKKFEIPFIVYMIFPASDYLLHLLRSIQTMDQREFSKRLLVVMLLTVFFRLGMDKDYPESKNRLFVDLPADYTELVDWTKANIPDDSRILFESGLTAKDMFLRPSFLYGFFSKETGSQLIGGPHRYHGQAGDFPLMTKNVFFRQLWDRLIPARIRENLTSYNIGWIIARSESTKSRLQKIAESAGIRHVKDIYDFSIYATDIPPSYLIGAAGNVSVDYNEIKISNLRLGEEHSFILKYHWIPSLTSTPPARLEPYYQPGCPVPFIKVSGVQTDQLLIRNGY